MIMANDTAFFAGSHNIKVASFSMLIDVSKHPEDVFFLFKMYLSPAIIVQRKMRVSLQ